MRHKRLIHYRRCHVCGAVTEQKVVIEKCNSCGKNLVPYLYFDDTQSPVPSDTETTMIGDRKYQPIWGLTAYW